MMKRSHEGIRSNPQDRAALIRYFIGMLLILSLSSGFKELAAETVLDSDVFFPQVVKGPLSGLLYESLLVISNPNSTAVEIKLGSSGVTLPSPTTFQLGPLETREIVLAGGSFEVGLVRLTSKSPVAAHVHISTKVSASTEVLEDVAILAQPLVSKVIVPVFVNSTVAENTGVAMVYLQNGQYKFTLVDSQGVQIRSRVEDYGFQPGRPSTMASMHASMFVTEIFPDVSPDFDKGSLVIEHSSPENIAMAFAITALYSRGTELASASISSVDEPASYVVLVKSGQNAQTLASQLAATYGFQVGFVRDTNFEAIATNEVARAVARDKAVSEVYPHATTFLSR